MTLIKKDNAVMLKHLPVVFLAVMFSGGCANSIDLQAECVRRCTDPCPGVSPISDEARCESTCDIWYAGLEEGRMWAASVGCSDQYAVAESCFTAHWCTSTTDCRTEHQAVTSCAADFCMNNPDHDACI